MIRFTSLVTAALAALWLGLTFSLPSFAQDFGSSVKPNILVIMGDDIGYWNISAYNRGMMGYRTPNIDRIADEGGIFTDYIWCHKPKREPRPGAEWSGLRSARPRRLERTP